MRHGVSDPEAFKLDHLLPHKPFTFCPPFNLRKGVHAAHAHAPSLLPLPFAQLAPHVRTLGRSLALARPLREFTFKTRTFKDTAANDAEGRTSVSTGYLVGVTVAQQSNIRNNTRVTLTSLKQVMREMGKIIRDT